MFYEFIITLENQKTEETTQFYKSIAYSKEYLDAWKYVAETAYKALEGLNNYWYIKSIEHRI